MPVRLEKFRRYARQRLGQAEVVEHRRVEQLRQIAHAVEGGFGDSAGLLERGLRARVRARRPQRDADGHLDRGQRLADFVVQLAGEAAALLLLRVDEARRQALEIEAVAGLGQPLPLRLALETGHVPGRKPCCREAQHQRTRDDPDKTRACVGVEARDIGIVPPLRRQVQRFQIVEQCQHILADRPDTPPQHVAARVVLVGRSSANTNSTEVQNSASFDCSFAHSSRSAVDCACGTYSATRRSVASRRTRS